MKRKIMNRMAVMCVAMSALALSFMLVGCDKDVSSTKSTSDSGDGTVKSKEKTVSQSPDGTTTTKTEESKSTTSTNKP
jgi:ABC-type oligopeptide transport system substrate-binding subunit